MNNVKTKFVADTTKRYYIGTQWQLIVILYDIRCTLLENCVLEMNYLNEQIHTNSNKVNLKHFH